MEKVNYNDKFEKVLNDNEKIITTSKATKRTFILKKIIVPAILTTFVTVLFSILAATLPYKYVGKGWYGDSYTTTGYIGFPWFAILIGGGVLLLITLFVLFCAIKGSNNYYACLTNERVIIRYGAFATKYVNYSIEKVSGNMSIHCAKSIFDSNNENACRVSAFIELWPVGHSHINLGIQTIDDGYDFAKTLEATVKANAQKLLKETKTKSTKQVVEE